MAALTADADIAIGAGGSSAWERCCLGLPSLVLILADNQRENAGPSRPKARPWRSTPPARISALPCSRDFGRLRDEPGLRQDLGRAAAALCDGEGAARVAARLIGLL